MAVAWKESDMDQQKHTILFVDDEENILKALKRLLRREGYRLLTATSGKEGLHLLRKYEVHLVVSDQRMPEMNGTDFLARIKEEFPDTIRIILTGYTEIDSITESINQGNIYKFFLKPWNDHSLKLELKKALEQYDLIHANKKLNAQVIARNLELKKINEDLESTVKERTRTLELQNSALELSRAVLEDIPMSVIGTAEDGTIALINQQSGKLRFENRNIMVGENISDYFSEKIVCLAEESLRANRRIVEKNYPINGRMFNLYLSPLSGRFAGKGTVMTLMLSAEPHD